MATSRTSAAAFLLHSTPYRETSLVVDLFTREHGRIAAVAKGAKRPRSALRAVLLQFQPLVASWTGNRELRTLTGAEWTGGLPAPQGDALLCAFYLNELLMRLLPREDAHPALYDAYEQALRELSEGAPADETLRRFEWLLLRETGYAPDLGHDASQRPIEAGRRYRWSPGGGFVAADPGEPSTVAGATLRELAEGRFASAASRQQAKYLTRAILAHHLDGAPLNTRQILIDLHKL
ncbi:DNA repair protein RecO [Burkholderiaceae bacterium FT117]|uniref:DNA repair protein RecO n=1 Tax=Zeimonas sediminis TaxID=2944268 RepID=UPI002342DA30|nr:DNA repair protein RecO [Zeimonas sediminis]MCM5569018.1 DNA repair protein RecO [Zeimonas sediminis]